MDLHVITPRGAVLVAQVVDGKVVLPPEIAPQTLVAPEIAGHKKQPEL
jgi:hypothetical protein